MEMVFYSKFSIIVLCTIKFITLDENIARDGLDYLSIRIRL